MGTRAAGNTACSSCGVFCIPRSHHRFQICPTLRHRRHHHQHLARQSVVVHVMAGFSLHSFHCCSCTSHHLGPCAVFVSLLTHCHRPCDRSIPHARGGCSDWRARNTAKLTRTRNFVGSCGVQRGCHRAHCRTPLGDARFHRGTHRRRPGCGPRARLYICGVAPYSLCSSKRGRHGVSVLLHQLRRDRHSRRHLAPHHRVRNLHSSCSPRQHSHCNSTRHCASSRCPRRARYRHQEHTATH